MGRGLGLNGWFLLVIRGATRVRARLVFSGFLSDGEL